MLTIEYCEIQYPNYQHKLISSQGVSMEFRNIYTNYQVSDSGVILGVRGNELKPFNNGRGYKIVKIKIAGKWTSKAVHRLVAEAWLPNPKNLPEVNHIDCNRDNNIVTNLEWCTHSYNVSYSYSQGFREVGGELNANCKTDLGTVLEICSLLQQRLKSSKIRDLGYDYDLVRAIKSRKNWKDISKDFHW